MSAQGLQQDVVEDSTKRGSGQDRNHHPADSLGKTALADPDSDPSRFPELTLSISGGAQRRPPDAGAIPLKAGDRPDSITAARRTPCT